MGFSEAGKTENPTFGTSSNVPTNIKTATSKVVFGNRIAPFNSRRYEPLIIQFKPRKKIFPFGFSWFNRIFDAKNGTIVSETNSEASIVVTTAIGKPRIKSPAPSGKNRSGRKAKINVAVQPTTASVICSVAFIEASKRFMPFRIKRSMFSTTTIESSTSNPKATTKPTILNWLMLKPVLSSKNKPMSNDIGIETMTTSDARKPNGIKVKSTKMIAIPKSLPKCSSRVRTLSALSNAFSNTICGGNCF